MREPNSGGYTYKVPFSGERFNRASFVVELSQARLRKAYDSDIPGRGFNAYIFFAVQNEFFTYDVGIFHGWSRDGEWRVFSGRLGDFEDHGVIVRSDYVDGSFIPRDDVRITVSVSEGKVSLAAENLTTGRMIEVTREHSSLGGNTALIKGTSYVPDNEPEHTPDWRNGAYLLNVIYRNAYLYRQSGVRGEYESISFWLDGSGVYYILTYNTDISQIQFIYDDDGNIVGEIVDIDYRFR